MNSTLSALKPVIKLSLLGTALSTVVCAIDLACLNLGAPVVDSGRAMVVRISNSCSSTLVLLTIRPNLPPDGTTAQFTEDYSNLIALRGYADTKIPSEPGATWFFRFTLPSTTQAIPSSVEPVVAIFEDGKTFGISDSISTVRQSWKGSLDAVRAQESWLAGSLSTETISQARQYIKDQARTDKERVLRSKGVDPEARTTRLDSETSAYVNGYRNEVESFVHSFSSDADGRDSRQIRQEFARRKRVFLVQMLSKLKS
jgi:hypothetical protein